MCYSGPAYKQLEYFIAVLFMLNYSQFYLRELR